jgi:hypothetical protein
VNPCTRYSAILAQACQHLWLVVVHDVYREFTCVHHTILPAPSPLDASRCTVPLRFGCQSGDGGYRVRGHLTARYLAAVPRRILLMEQQVWSVQLARQSTLRPRVTAPTTTGPLPLLPHWRSVRLPHMGRCFRFRRCAHSTFSVSLRCPSDILTPGEPGRETYPHE